MSSLLFVKMQAVGNDFVVVDGEAWPGGDWARRAIRLCDRRFGVGGDGLIVVGPSDAADLRMRFFNPDGTEDFCGNGLRCVVRIARVWGRVGGEGNIETLAGVRRFRYGNSDGGERITVEVGAPRFAPPELPMIADSDHVMDYPLPLDG